MKENHSSDEENHISGDQPGINFVKDDTFENVLDMSVIENMKKNKTLLTTDKMNQVIAAKKKDPNANIIDEDFLRLVWSICKMDKIDEKEFDKQCQINDILSQIRQNFAYEFLLCCYKLDLSPKSLAGFFGIDNSASYINELCNDTESKGNNLIKMAFLTNRKPINIKFLYWLEESGYFDKSCSSITLENFIKKRTEQNIGNYEFDSYDEFKEFIDNEKYEGATVYVTELLKVLKKENKFLEPAELERLAEKKLKYAEEMQGYFYSRICFKNPKDLTEDDLNGWTKQDAEYVNKIGITAPNELDLRRRARRKYWEYIKCIFFGDAKKDIRGLFNTKALSDEVIDKILKSILRYSSGNYSFLNIEGVADKEDIFSSDTSTWLCDDIKKFRDQFLSEENSKYRIISGGILLAIGIIGCGVILGIGLTSKLVIALFLFSVTTAVVGIVCLLWGKISSCLSVCTPFNGSGLSETDKFIAGDMAPNIENDNEISNRNII